MTSHQQIDRLSKRLWDALLSGQTAGLPSISAAVTVDGATIWHSVAGTAQVENRVLADGETQYRIASVTKLFTAAAVLRLMEAGQVDLDAPASEYLPDVPTARGVRIRELLCHTSGLQREIPGNVWLHLEFPDSQATLAALAQARLFSPKGLWRYSNVGYVMLGAIVERASGLSFEDFVAKELLAPLGLTRTSFTSSSPAATGYLRDRLSGALIAERSVALNGTSPQGGMWSTPQDLCKWANVYYQPNPVLGDEAIAQTATCQVIVDPAQWTVGWGLGPALIRMGSHLILAHAGQIPGFSSALYVVPSERVAAAVVTNATGAAADIFPITIQLIEATLEEVSAPARDWSAPPPPCPDEYTQLLGTWWCEGIEFAVLWEDGELIARAPNAASFEAYAAFTPETADAFRVVRGRMQGELLEVVRKPNGEIARLSWGELPMSRVPQPAGTMA